MGGMLINLKTFFFFFLNERGKWMILSIIRKLWYFLEYDIVSRAHSKSLLAKSLQSCPTLCNPIDGSPSGSPVPGILQARTLEWIAISFSKAWKWKVKVKLLSHVWLLATPRTAAYQAPPSLGFSRQEYWSGVPLPSPTSSLEATKNRTVLSISSPISL